MACVSVVHLLCSAPIMKSIYFLLESRVNLSNLCFACSSRFCLLGSVFSKQLLVGFIPLGQTGCNNPCLVNARAGLAGDRRRYCMAAIIWWRTLGTLRLTLVAYGNYP